MAATTARRWLTRSLMTVGTTLFASMAWAQASDVSTFRMPLWDASGSVAFHNVRASEAQAGPDDFDYWEANAELRGQVGRYLTPTVVMARHREEARMIEARLEDLKARAQACLLYTSDAADE